MGVINQKIEHFPLSYGQRRLWFLEQFASQSSLDTLHIAVQLSGLFDLVAFYKSIHTILRRHDVLRSCFTFIANQPRRFVYPSTSIPLQYIDLRMLPTSLREEVARELAVEETELPFDLTIAPLLRIVIIQTSSNKQLIVFTSHRIIFDHRSFALFFSELSQLYNASDDVLPSLPQLSQHFVDFVHWQSSYVNDKHIKESYAYWQQHLNNAPAPLQLPEDAVRLTKPYYQCGICTLNISEIQAEKIRSFCQSQSTNLFAGLLATFAILLSRYSSQDDLTITTCADTFRGTYFMQVIGAFTNILPIRIQLNGNRRFRDFLAYVDEVVEHALSHSLVPFEEIVEQVSPTQKLSRNPFSRISFAVHDIPTRDLQLQGLVSHPQITLLSQITSDLDVTVYEYEKSLTILLQYNREVFTHSTIEKFANHWQVLLETAIVSPQLKTGELPLFTLSEIQRFQMHAHGHKPKAKHSKQCIHQTFEDLALSTPDAIALVYQDMQITYEYLEHQANQLARFLHKYGVSSDTLVGVCMERSLEMVTSLLAILKAGGAYVPIDPQVPSERLAFMIEDAHLPIIVTQSTLASLLTNYTGIVLNFDKNIVEFQKESTLPLPCSVTADNLAYVIYTSGSTGQSKGVLVEHRNVVRLFEVTNECLGFSNADTWTLFHSYAFDFSVWELWGALAYGGRLVIVPHVITHSADDFYQFLYEQEVTILNQTPTAFSQLIQSERRSGVIFPLAVRLIIFGGEALRFQMLEPWFASHPTPPLRYINMYGITETTIHSTYYELPCSPFQISGSIIGNALDNLRIYVLNEYFEPVPIGVVGELYIAGSGLARGYLEKPALTAERFIPDPFSIERGERLYKTGDLGRYRTDGLLEYVGRLDEQIKLRGYRIEPGEIETLLRHHPAINDAVIALSREDGEDGRFVAFLISSTTHHPSVADLRLYLRQHLPDYMIPSVCFYLNTFPLTTNGKVNRQILLRNYIHSHKIQQNEGKQPEKIEEILIYIWKEILGNEAVSIHDNFFDLGGHSLQVTQIVIRVQSSLQFRLPTRTIFDMPTIAQLTDYIISTKANQKTSTKPSLLSISRDQEEIE